MNREEKRRMTVYINPMIFSRLKRIARKERRSLTAVVGIALERIILDYELQVREKRKQIMEQVNSGGKPVI
jgi:predicted transcriptional regulator